MATHHGTEGQVYNGANQVGELNDFTLNINAAFAEDTNGEDTARTFHETAITDWDGSMECWYDETDTNGQEALAPGQSVTLNLRPEGTGTGSSQFSGLARITGSVITKNKGGIVTRNISFQGSGALSTTAQ